MIKYWTLVNIYVKGPYKLVIKQLYSCNPTNNNKIQYNWYLSHKDNTTFVLGNSTNIIPFDDTLSVSNIIIESMYLLYI